MARTDPHPGHFHRVSVASPLAASKFSKDPKAKFYRNRRMLVQSLRRFALHLPFKYMCMSKTD